MTKDYTDSGATVMSAYYLVFLISKDEKKTNIEFVSDVGLFMDNLEIL
jgi:hypothetical protein